ncbi:protein NLP7-like [Bidens hawaiensis]|uniref:protein NLP7-like n=1 Tax=Bidens hawaiensis TaxID=980011 RepID=UPI00404B5A3F
MYPVCLKRKFEPVDYEDKDVKTVSRIEVTSARQLSSPCSYDSRYMTSHLVFRANKKCLELGAASVDPNHQKIQDKIEAALKVLTFREQHVLIQFWGPREVGIGKHQLLTNEDQPYGLGVDNEGLRSYRRVSESKDHEEEDFSPAARVFRLRLPEWSFNLHNCTLKQFPQKESANRCNLHGYLALPVFNLTTKLCVGVLELLTSSTTYTSYAYEVNKIHDALKNVNLTSQQGFHFPALYVLNEGREKDLNEISGIMKAICDIHDLPLAQTWAVPQHTSFVAHGKVIENSCSSFDTRCVGKVCMSTAALPFHLKDGNLWSFRKECTERHLDRSSGPVGKALSTRGSWFCTDVTKLGEDEYPLVHNARMYGLTGCFTISLHSVEPNEDYVLEFFLPAHIKERRHVQNLVHTLKQNFEIAFGFELGDTSMMQVVGQPTDSSVSMVTTVTQTFSDSVADNFMSSDAESLMPTASTDAGQNSKGGQKTS